MSGNHLRLVVNNNQTVGIDKLSDHLHDEEMSMEEVVASLDEEERRELHMELERYFFESRIEH